jgi:hypothetical protein
MFSLIFLKISWEGCSSSSFMEELPMVKLHYLIKKLLNYNVMEHSLILGQMTYYHA